MSFHIVTMDEAKRAGLIKLPKWSRSLVVPSDRGVPALPRPGDPGHWGDGWMVEWIEAKPHETESDKFHVWIDLIAVDAAPEGG